MSTDERRRRLLAHVRPAAAGDDRAADLMAAALADVQGRVAAALSLYVRGDHQAVSELLGYPDSIGASVGAVPLLAAFDAAAEAITAAVGDDRARGYAALATLEERAAEFSTIADQLLAGHSANN